jgi:GT2 family glycosyltransferase
VTHKKPELSIIIASFNARDTIEACLDSLRQQKTERPFEVILVDSSTDGTSEFVRNHYPEVRLITSPDRLHCGDARNRALAIARAEVIAFLDADSYVDAEWVETLIETHRADCLLAGGIIDNASHTSLAAWAYYFCEYSLWLPARRQRHIREMAGCCLSFKRSAFDRYGPFIEGTYCSDTAFQWKLRGDGHQVLFTPKIRIYHQAPASFSRFIAHIFEHRRAFARVKSREKRLSTQRCAMEITILPIAPLLLMGATLLRLRRCWRYLPYYLACSPLLFSGYCVRSLGELVGYLSPQRTGV